jgi:glycerate kinase
MKITIVPDSFKGCMTSKQVGAIIAEAMMREIPSADVEIIPAADGGEGTVESVISVLGGRYETVTVKNPMFDDIKARYGIAMTTAVMEMSAASGLTLLAENQRNPMATTTYGTGQMILDAIEKGCDEIVIGIGGSATNDGGCGMAQALGAVFYDSDGNVLEMCGKNLALIDRIDISKMHPALKHTKFRVACDVTNPLCGETGAAYTFARQKGADDAAIELLDRGLRHFADKVKSDLGLDILTIEGGGAAGGLGAGLTAFCGGKLESGFSIISDIIGLDEKIRNSDVVITGEGRTDSQTIFGKLPSGVGGIAKKYTVPCIIISGAVAGDISGLYEKGITAAFSCVSETDTSLEQALAGAETALARTARNVARMIKHMNGGK